MPAVAAHVLFGQAVFSQLPQSIQSYLAPQRDYWTLGFQGPDLLFYHKPLTHSPVALWGNTLHSQSPQDFFQTAPWDSPQQVAYLLGVCCHYGLDRGCHPLVNQACHQETLGHRLLESAFDYHLLHQNHLPLTRFGLIPKLQDYKPIATAYGLPPKVASQCGRSFRHYTALLDRPKVIALARKPGFSALCLPQQPMYVQDCLALEAAFHQAIPSTVPLVCQLYQWLTQDQPFPSTMAENFEGELPQ